MTYLIPATLGELPVSNIRQAILSTSPIIHTIRKDPDLLVQFKKAVYVECMKFLLMFDIEDEKCKAIADAFKDDIVDTRDTWKPEDVVMFFKTIRQRQDVPEFQLMGNKITILKLNEMVCAYEGIRADESVEVHKEQAFKQIGEGVSERSQEWALEITERLGKKKPVDMSRAVSTQNWHRENQEKEKELLAELQAGKITEDEYLQQYNKFLIR